MRQSHFLVSIKTIDDTPLFPKSFNGENFLFQAVLHTMNSTGVISKGYASFPTGFEAVICCKHVVEARNFISLPHFDKEMLYLAKLSQR